MRRLTRPLVLGAILALQGLCALFFVSDILLSVLGLYAAPISWQSREILELAAAFGLIAGLLLGAIALARALRDAHQSRARLRRATVSFGELVEERFDDWRLTPAERDVALFALKGLGTAEIARIRGTSEGTAKAQTAAIYRKAGVNGRGELLSLFIEDLIEAGPMVEPAAEAPRRIAG